MDASMTDEKQVIKSKADVEREIDKATSEGRWKDAAMLGQLLDLPWGRRGIPV